MSTFKKMFLNLPSLDKLTFYSKLKVIIWSTGATIIHLVEVARYLHSVSKYIFVFIFKCNRLKKEHYPSY